MMDCFSIDVTSDFLQETQIITLYNDRITERHEDLINSSNSCHENLQRESTRTPMRVIRVTSELAVEGN